MKKSKLHTIKQTGLKTPESYFDNFEERLFKKIAVIEELSEITVTGYNIPDQYFEDFDANLYKKLDSKRQPKVVPLWSWRNTAYVSAAAAVLILMLTILMPSNELLLINQVETASIETYLNNENLSIYDIASFLDTEDIIADDFVVNTFSDESLENYLLNNTSIEDLINEK